MARPTFDLDVEVIRATDAALLVRPDDGGHKRRRF